MRSLKKMAERGSAMFIAILLVVIGFATLMAISELAGNNFRRTDNYMAREQSFYAAVGGVDYVYSDIWGRFVSDRESDGRTKETYGFRQFLLENPFTDINGNSVVLGHYGMNDVGTDSQIPAGYLEVKDYNGFRIGNSQITRVRLSRNDYNDPMGNPDKIFTDLRVEVEATTDTGEAVWASRIIQTVNREPFGGIHFAVLTKNITCSLCHMRVQSITKVNGLGNPATYGDSTKIRVGTTELLATRPDSAQTTIEGALYHRGRIEEEFSGNAIDYGTVVGSTIKSVSQDSETGTVRQNAADGSVNVVNLASSGVVDTAAYRTSNGINEDGDGSVDESDESKFAAPKGQRRVNSSSGVPNKNDSLYLEYPKTEAEMTASDGPLPIDSIVDEYDPSKDLRAFPEPFKDNNKNRLIDADEILQQVNGALNTTKNGPGTLNAGIGVRLAPGEVYGSAAMPVTTSTTVKVGATRTSSYGGYANKQTNGINVVQTGTGTYVLTGTEANPIQINGKVVIEGDVMIQGYVKGEGQIYASGNVYVPNDIKYLNRTEGGNEVFGQNSDYNPVTGTYKRNLLGLTSGGTIVVGDYLGTVTHYDSGQAKFYDHGMPEVGRKLDRAVMPSLPNTGLNHLGGDRNSANTNYVNFANFVMEELSFFNQSELVRVSKKNKSSTETNQTSAWGKDNLYNPSSNPAGQWRVVPGQTSTNYVPRFYRMYGEFPQPGDVASTANTPLEYGKSYAGTGQLVKQFDLQNSPVPFYVNRSMTWDNGKGYYKNTGDPHTYNSIAEVKLNFNSVTGKWDYDDNFFTTGDALNPTDASTNRDNRIPKDVLDMGSVGKARILDVHPKWITPTNMMNLLLTEEQRRNDNNSSTITPRQIDGLLYTNNSIFMIERKQTQKNSGSYDPATGVWSGTWSKVPTESQGSFVVNGAIIAPDMGILIPGGTKTSGTAKKGYTPTRRGGSTVWERQAFTVNYDPRVKDLLTDLGDKKVWESYRKGWSRTLGKMP